MANPVSTPAPAYGPVKAIGILEVVFGAMGVFSWPMMQGLRSLTQAISRDPVSRRIDELTWSGTMGTWTRIAMVLGSLLGVALVAAGIGVLKRRPWGRKLSLAYGAAALVSAIIGQAMTWIYLMPELERATRTAHDPASRGAAWGGLLGGGAGAIAGAMLPVGLLIIMTRPEVKRVFGEESAGRSPL